MENIFLGDIIVISAIIYSAGRNFAFEENVFPLFLGFIMFFISISKLKNIFPITCEILGSFSLLSGYYPLWIVHINKIESTPFGMIIAMMLGILAYVLLIIGDIKIKKYAPGNIIALIFMSITLFFMMWNFFFNTIDFFVYSFFYY